MRPSQFFGSPWVESNLRHLRKPPAKVLDVACGRGRHSLLLLDRGYEVVAVDCDEAAIAQLEKRTPESARDRLQTCRCNLENLEAWPDLLSAGTFAMVLVVNYLHRPLLNQLLGLLEPDGLLVYETWAVGNEAFACPKDSRVISERSLRPNELLDLVLPSCEVLGYSHGLLEDYEGRDCAKQMICARLLAQTHTRPRNSKLASLLAGELAGEAFLDESFGRVWLHAAGKAPELDFGITALLELLRNYNPVPAREAHMSRMQRLTVAGASVPKLTCDTPGERDAPPRLWGATMVRRLPLGKGGALCTETINDDAKIRAFLSEAQLDNAVDLIARGDNWTFVVHQLQGAADSLRNLHHHLYCITGLSGGFNGYLTPAGAVGKPPHIDDHDVVVLQVAGQKLWMLLDTVTKEVTAEVRLEPGDVLYLPQGIPHHARALDGEDPSLHLAVGLHRSPMSAGALLGALITARSLGYTPGALTTAIVEEMDSRTAAFLAFGDREHWTNQLLPACLHIPLVRALDPEDVQPKTKDDLTHNCLHGLALKLVALAQQLLELIRKSPVAVAGDSQSRALNRAMEQASAKASEADLEGVVNTSPTELLPWVAWAFWSRREHVMDHHYARYGPYYLGDSCATSATKLAADILEGSCEGYCWCRAAQQVSAMWRPSSVLRVNGFRFSDLADGEAQAARFCLRTSLGSAGRPFTMAEIPGTDVEKRSILSGLVSIGAIERKLADGKS